MWATAEVRPRSARTKLQTPMSARSGPRLAAAPRRTPDAGQLLVPASGFLGLQQISAKPDRGAIADAQRPQGDCDGRFRHVDVERDLIVSGAEVLDGAPNDDGGVAAVHRDLGAAVPFEDLVTAEPGDAVSAGDGGREDRR